MQDTPLPKADIEHILALTEDLWRDMRGSRIFITGATGFFGKWLLATLAAANLRLDAQVSVVALSRHPDRFRTSHPHLASAGHLAWHCGDVMDFDFPSGSFDHVIHAATEASATLNSDAPAVMFATIVDGTRHTLDFARSCGAANVLLASSGAVYGRQPPELSHIPEDFSGAPDPLDPRSAYGEGKRAAELLSSIAGRDGSVEPKIARCFAFVGPYLPLDAHFAIGNFLRDALAGQPIVVSGDGTPYRSYLYAADLAVWLWTILLRGQANRPYNVGSEESINIAALADRCARLPERAQGVTIQQQVKKVLPERYVPDTSRARSELGLAQTTSFDEALRRTYAWHVRMAQSR